MASRLKASPRTGEEIIKDIFLNPPGDLTYVQKAAVRDAIAALALPDLPDPPDVPDKATVAALNAVDSTDTDLSTDLDAANTADDDGFLTVRRTLRLLQRLIKTASTTLRGVVLIARNTDVDSTLTDTSRVLTVAQGLRLIQRVAAGLASVSSVSVNTNIPESGDGNTYRLTGNQARGFFLPGASSVRRGWQFVAVNASSEILTVTPNGADTIDGRGALSVPAGESVKIQAVASNRFSVIADTGKGSAGAAFAPNKANLYPAVKAIFSHNSAISADDDNNELDVSVGAAAALADDSLLPAKAKATTVAEKKAWRDRLASSQISQVSAALPAAAGYNSGDLVIVARGGNTATTFIDLDDPSTQLNTTVAGDLIMLLAGRWSRLGNLFSGGIAAAAANATANANKAIVDNLHTFGEVVVTPPGIPDRDFPEFIGLSLSEKLSPKTLTGIQVRLLGQSIANVVGAENIAPFNGLVAGGIINCSLTPEQRANLRDNAATANQWVSGELRFTFEDGSSAINQWTFGTSNASFRPHAYRELTGVAGASRIWTFQLSPADTEVLVVMQYAANANNGYHTGVFPRALFTAANQQFVIDARVADQNLPDPKTGGFVGSISAAHVLTVNTNGYYSSGTPRIFVK